MRADLAPTGVDGPVDLARICQIRLTDANSFAMPFMIEADDAAKAIADGIESARPETVFPLPMAATMKLLSLVPHRLWTPIWKRTISASASATEPCNMDPTCSRPVEDAVRSRAIWIQRAAGLWRKRPDRVQYGSNVQPACG